MSGRCGFGELIGGEDPGVCRKWYEASVCSLPSVKGPFTKGLYLQWMVRQARCEADETRGPRTEVALAPAAREGCSALRAESGAARRAGRCAPLGGAL
jgi:hypothetical protein